MEEREKSLMRAKILAERMKSIVGDNVTLRKQKLTDKEPPGGGESSNTKENDDGNTLNLQTSNPSSKTMQSMVILFFMCSLRFLLQFCFPFSTASLVEP